MQIKHLNGEIIIRHSNIRFLGDVRSGAGLAGVGEGELFLTEEEATSFLSDKAYQSALVLAINEAKAFNLDRKREKINSLEQELKQLKNSLVSIKEPAKNNLL